MKSCSYRIIHMVVTYIWYFMRSNLILLINMQVCRVLGMTWPISFPWFKVCCFWWGTEFTILWTNIRRALANDFISKPLHWLNTLVQHKISFWHIKEMNCGMLSIPVRYVGRIQPKSLQDCWLKNQDRYKWSYF